MSITAREFFDATCDSADDVVVLADGPDGPAYWMAKRDDQLYVYDHHESKIDVPDDLDIEADITAWIAVMDEARRRTTDDSGSLYHSRV